MKRLSARTTLAVLQGASWRHVIMVAAVIALSAAYSAEVAAQNAPAAAVETSPAPLKPPAAAESERKPIETPSLWPLMGSLVLVLGLFFALAWLMRRLSPHGIAVLPPEAFEVLGRAPLANRQQAHLVRCGNKLWLIAVGAAGASPLGEIADADEVERLTQLCRQARPAAAPILCRAWPRKGGGSGA